MDTLDAHMTRKLAIRSLRRGVGSMDYIHTLLIMEDDLNNEPSPDVLRMSHLTQVPLETNMELIGACVGIADQCHKR